MRSIETEFKKYLHDCGCTQHDARQLVEALLANDQLYREWLKAGAALSLQADAEAKKQD